MPETRTRIASSSASRSTDGAGATFRRALPVRGPRAGSATGSKCPAPTTATGNDADFFEPLYDAVTVIVDTPSATPFTTPVASTDATSGRDDANASCAFAGSRKLSSFSVSVTAVGTFPPALTTRSLGRAVTTLSASARRPVTRSGLAKRTSSADAAISMRQSPFGTTRRVPSQKQQSDT